MKNMIRIIGILVFLVSHAQIFAAATVDTGYCIEGPREACVDPVSLLCDSFMWVIHKSDLSEFKQRMPLLHELDESSINQLWNVSRQRKELVDYWDTYQEYMPSILAIMHKTYLHPTQKRTSTEITVALKSELKEREEESDGAPTAYMHALRAVSEISCFKADIAVHIIQTIEAHPQSHLSAYLQREREKCEALMVILDKEMQDFEHESLKSGRVTQNLYVVHRKSRPDHIALSTTLLRCWKDAPEFKAKREALLNSIDRDENSNGFDEVLRQLAQEDFVSTSLVGLDIETCVYGLNACAACTSEEIKPVLALGQKLQAGVLEEQERAAAIGEHATADTDRTLMLGKLFNELDLASERSRYAGFRLWWGIERAHELFGAMEEPEKSQCMENDRARLFSLLKKVHTCLDDWKVKHAWIDNPDTEQWGPDHKVFAIRAYKKQKQKQEKESTRCIS